MPFNETIYEKLKENPDLEIKPSEEALNKLTADL
jgi:hypothetical protein